MIRISGRNSAIPPGCACVSRAQSQVRRSQNRNGHDHYAFPSYAGNSAAEGNPSRASPSAQQGNSARTDKLAGDGKPGNSFAEDAAPPCDRAQHLLGFVLFQTSLKVRAELFELPKTDSLANFAHYVKVKVDVVVGVQDDREEFSARC